MTVAGHELLSMHKGPIAAATSAPSSGRGNLSHCRTRARLCALALCVKSVRLIANVSDKSDKPQNLHVTRVRLVVKRKRATVANLPR